MPLPVKFLVVDFHAESRYLLVKTLLRKYPNAIIEESDEADKAVELTRSTNYAVIISHRTFDVSGVELVKMLRTVDTRVPIVLVSGFDRAAEAVAAGATMFLSYDEWLRLGTVVERLISDAGDASATDAAAS